MEAERFDTFVRALIGGSSRRRLLAGLLTGIALGHAPRPAAAQECGCHPDQACLRDPDGTFRGCCGGTPCPGPDGFYLHGACCHGDNHCCAGVCCAADRRCVTPRVCGVACLAGQTECGRGCCGEGQECGAGDQCIATCPAGTTRCGGTCCEHGCEGGGTRCALPPPPPPPPCNGTTCNGVCCGAGVGCDVSGDCGAACEAPLISCKGTCILPCPPGRALNADTCACKCEGQVCGTICCGADQECSNDGSEGGVPTCCAAGKSCGLLCKGAPHTKCCTAGPTSAGGFACAKSDICCGKGACCKKGKQSCAKGKCKPKK